MKAYGKRKSDDECCPGHTKYPGPGKPHGRKTAQDKLANKARKAKIRHTKIELDDL